MKAKTRNLMTITAILILSIFILATAPNPAVEAMPMVPPREDTFVIHFSTKLMDPELWNPFVPGYSAPYRAGLYTGCYEMLFYTNSLTGELIPWLATGMSYSEDFKTLTVNLREGVKWSDGVNFTADDVVFTYEMMLENAPLLMMSSDVSTHVKEARKIDDYTVEIELYEANPRFHFIRFAFFNSILGWSIVMVPKHIWEDVADPLTFKNNPPIGTGPYVLIEATETRALWRRNDDYWNWDVQGVRPTPEFLEARYYGTADVLMMAMSRDEVDLAGFMSGFTVTAMLDVIDKNPSMSPWMDDPPYQIMDVCPRQIAFNNAKYPWSLKEVRWAMTYAIDRSNYFSAIYGGEYSVPVLGVMFPVELISPEYRAAFDAVVATIPDYTEYNPAKAEEILASIPGFEKKADGFWYDANGDKLAPDCVFSGVSPPQAPIIEANLQAIGLDPTIVAVQSAVFSDRANMGYFDMLFMHQCGSTMEPFINFDLYHSRHYKPIGEATGWHLDTCRWQNTTYDDILDEWRTLAHEDPRAIELFAQAIEIYLQELPEAPLDEAMAAILTNTEYWVNWPSSENPYIMTQWWWATSSLMLTGYESPKTGEYIGGVAPRTVDTTSIMFTDDTIEFRGADLKWYGPFVTGDSAIVPVDDAEFLIWKDVATYGMGAIAADVAETKSNVAELTSEVQGLTALMGNLTLATGILGVGVIILAGALMIIVRRE